MIHTAAPSKRPNIQHWPELSPRLNPNALPAPALPAGTLEYALPKPGKNPASGVPAGPRLREETQPERYQAVEYLPMIRDLPQDLRPRERMLYAGAGALNSAELLAIILRTGVKGESVVRMAEGLLARLGGVDEDKTGRIRANGIAEDLAHAHHGGVQAAHVDGGNADDIVFGV